MKNVSELMGSELDYWVSVACGEDKIIKNIHETPRYSTDWSLAGPIIEKEGICLHIYIVKWEASIIGDKTICCEASTPLLAAMRCYVTFILGELV